MRCCLQVGLSIILIQFAPGTQMSEEIAKNRRNKYKKIDEEKRMEIIERIIQKGQQLKTVSESIGINVSTCKAIIKVFQEEGRVGKKKTRNKVVEVVETYSFYVLENSKLTQLCPLKMMNSKVSVEQKQMAEDAIEKSCKQKAEKMLEEAIQAHKKNQQTIRQTQGLTQNSFYPNHPSMMPFAFYAPF